MEILEVKYVQNREEIEKNINELNCVRLTSLDEKQIIKLCQCYNAFALVLLNDNKIQEALEYLRKSENLAINYPVLRADAYNAIARFYAKQGKASTALKYIERSLSLFPSGNAYVNLCSVLALQGKHEKSLEIAMHTIIFLQDEIFETVYEGKPLNVDSTESLSVGYYNLAVQLEHLKRTDEANSYYKKAVEFSGKYLTGNNPVKEILKQIYEKIIAGTLKKFETQRRSEAIIKPVLKKRIVIKNTMSKSPTVKTSRESVKSPLLTERVQVKVPIHRKMVQTGITKAKMRETISSQREISSESEVEVEIGKKLASTQGFEKELNGISLKRKLEIEKEIEKKKKQSWRKGFKKIIIIDGEKQESGSEENEENEEEKKEKNQEESEEKEEKNQEEVEVKDEKEEENQEKIEENDGKEEIEKKVLERDEKTGENYVKITRIMNEESIEFNEKLPNTPKNSPISKSEFQNTPDSEVESIQKDDGVVKKLNFSIEEAEKNSEVEVKVIPGLEFSDSEKKLESKSCTEKGSEMGEDDEKNTEKECENDVGNEKKVENYVENEKKVEKKCENDVENGKIVENKCDSLGEVKKTIEIENYGLEHKETLVAEGQNYVKYEESKETQLLSQLELEEMLIEAEKVDLESEKSFESPFQAKENLPNSNTTENFLENESPNPETEKFPEELMAIHSNPQEIFKETAKFNPLSFHPRISINPSSETTENLLTTPDFFFPNSSFSNSSRKSVSELFEIKESPIENFENPSDS